MLFIENGIINKVIEKINFNNRENCFFLIKFNINININMQISPNINNINNADKFNIPWCKKSSPWSIYINSNIINRKIINWYFEQIPAWTKKRKIKKYIIDCVQ